MSRRDFFQLFCMFYLRLINRNCVKEKKHHYLTLCQNWNRTPVYFKLAVSASYRVKTLKRDDKAMQVYNLIEWNDRLRFDSSFPCPLPHFRILILSIQWPPISFIFMWILYSIFLLIKISSIVVDFRIPSFPRAGWGIFPASHIMGDSTSYSRDMYSSARKKDGAIWIKSGILVILPSN